MKNMPYVTASTAAKKIGCSVATVVRWADRLGFNERMGNYRMLTAEQVKEIKDTWKKSSGNPNMKKNNGKAIAK